MRRVPLDLRDQVGKQAWRWLLAHDLETARQGLPGALAETDGLIATLRGEEAPSTATGDPLPESPRALTREQDRLMLQGRPALIRELLEVSAPPLPDPNDHQVERCRLPRPVPDQGDAADNASGHLRCAPSTAAAYQAAPPTAVMRHSTERQSWGARLEVFRVPDFVWRGLQEQPSTAEKKESAKHQGPPSPPDQDNNYHQKP